LIFFVVSIAPIETSRSNDWRSTALLFHQNLESRAEDNYPTTPTAPTDPFAFRPLVSARVLSEGKKNKSRKKSKMPIIRNSYITWGELAHHSGVNKSR
jgi:hypothetical protein